MIQRCIRLCRQLQRSILKLKRQEQLNFFSLQTILMTENKPVCFRNDDMFLTQENIRLQDFILYKLWKTGKRFSVPDVLAISVNSQSCTNDWLVWETLFSGLRGACWIKTERKRRKKMSLHTTHQAFLYFSYCLLSTNERPNYLMDVCKWQYHQAMLKCN